MFLLIKNILIRKQPNLKKYFKENIKIPDPKILVIFIFNLTENDNKN